jgi:Cu(I)/Ag(I) efflux system periplasmic protein CusF
MRTIAVTTLLVTALTMPALAEKSHHGSEAAGAGTSHSAAALSDGEIRRVDKDAKKITVRHGPLANLDMPAMTMVFQVKDPAMLDQVKVGDKVKFQAEKIGGAFTITRIEPAQ